MPFPLDGVRIDGRISGLETDFYDSESYFDHGKMSSFY